MGKGNSSRRKEKVREEKGRGERECRMSQLQNDSYAPGRERE
jgi:hypothetical protein